MFAAWLMLLLGFPAAFAGTGRDAFQSPVAFVAADLAVVERVVRIAF